MKRWTGYWIVSRWSVWKIKLKMFHAEIMNDIEKLSDEVKKLFRKKLVGFWQMNKRFLLLNFSIFCWKILNYPYGSNQHVMVNKTKFYGIYLNLCYSKWIFALDRLQLICYVPTWKSINNKTESIQQSRLTSPFIL